MLLIFLFVLFHEFFSLPEPLFLIFDLRFFFIFHKNARLSLAALCRPTFFVCPCFTYLFSCLGKMYKKLCEISIRCTFKTIFILGEKTTLLLRYLW